MRKWPWQKIAVWVFAITIVAQLWGINDKLDAIRKHAQYIESNTERTFKNLTETLNVNVENSPLEVHVQ